MKKLICTLTFALLTAHAQAQSLTLREDIKEGKKASYSAGLVVPQGEIWGFNLTQFPIVEIGRLHYQPLSKRASVLVGGYLSLWTIPHQTYVEPFSIWKARVGTTAIYTKAAAYAPLNGGAWQAFGEANASWNVAKGLSVGPAVDWWLTDGRKPSYGLGAVATLKGEHSSLSIRGLCRAHSQEVRLEVNLF